MLTEMVPGHFVKPMGYPSGYTPEQHKMMIQVFAAALAEVGHPITYEWDDVLCAYRYSPRIEPEVCNRARIVAFESVGIPWEWAPGRAHLGVSQLEGRDMTTEKGGLNEHPT